VKVLVCGSREWLSQAAIERELSKLPEESIIVHGACRGADNIAGFVGKALGFEVRPYPAQWGRYGRGAGPVRNQQMLDEEHLPDEPIDVVMAFHGDQGLGVGTVDMVKRSRKASPTIEVRVFHR
jgi:YspA, cpYpsA-related SLOG family